MGQRQLGLLTPSLGVKLSMEIDVLKFTIQARDDGSTKGLPRLNLQNIVRQNNPIYETRDFVVEHALSEFDGHHLPGLPMFYSSEDFGPFRMRGNSLFDYYAVLCSFLFADDYFELLASGEKLMFQTRQIFFARYDDCLKCLECCFLDGGHANSSGQQVEIHG